MNPKGLTVGAVVCDCRYDHQRIVEIEFEYVPHWTLKLLKWLPFPIFEKLVEIWPRAKDPYDAQLVLENGMNCSALYCCNEVPHEWEHPSKEEIAERMRAFEGT